jgi:hypothetical protein
MRKIICEKYHISSHDQPSTSVHHLHEHSTGLASSQSASSRGPQFTDRLGGPSQLKLIWESSIFDPICWLNGPSLKYSPIIERLRYLFEVQDIRIVRGLSKIPTIVIRATEVQRID